MNCAVFKSFREGCLNALQGEPLVQLQAFVAKLFFVYPLNGSRSNHNLNTLWLLSASNWSKIELTLKV